MTNGFTIDQLSGLLRDLHDWLAATKVRGIVIGGVAAAILGRPRATRDVDLLVLVPDEQWAGFVDDGKPFGFEPRVRDSLAFARRSRVLLMRHTPTTVDVDVTLAALPFESEMLDRATTKTIAAVRVSIPAAEDLIVMKAIAGRPRDLADIEGVLAAQPKVDRKAVLATVRGMAEALEQPEILERVRALLAEPRKRR